MKRRNFLQGSIQTVVVSSALTIFNVPFSIAKNTSSQLELSSPDWKTIASLHDYLLPSEEDSPGAKEIFSAEYFYFVLNQPDIDPDELLFLIRGTKHLSDLSMRENKKPFFSLNSEEKEKTLRKMETTGDGYYWLRSMLHYLLEALLGDPVYGGNPQGIGWRWLEIKPGFPRPIDSKAAQNIRVPVL